MDQRDLRRDLAHTVSLRSSKVAGFRLNQVSLDDFSVAESCSRILQDAPSDACPSSEWGVIRDWILLVEQLLPQSNIKTYDYA